MKLSNQIIVLQEKNLELTMALASCKVALECAIIRLRSDIDKGLVVQIDKAIKEARTAIRRG